MAKKRKTSRALPVKRSSGESQKMSPIIQFAVIFIIVAAIALAYYVGSMK